MTSWDVIGFGALNWDLIYELSDLSVLKDNLDISIVSGEEIHLDDSRLPSLLNLLNKFGAKKSESGGGQAANTACALAKMGFKTRILGKVGEDEWGDLILHGLAGVDTSIVKRQGRSGICISILTPGGDRSIVVFPGVNNDLSAEEIDSSSVSDSKFLHLTSFASNRPLKVQINLVREMGNDTLISFDPGSLYARLGLNAIMPILEKTYCLFATESEFETMAGLPCDKAAEQFLDIGVKIVVCKRGAKGACLFNSQARLDFPPLRVKVRDATGAGDCFAAGFLAGIIKGFDLNICGHIGTMAATACIKGYGRESYPDKSILNKFI